MKAKNGSLGIVILFIIMTSVSYYIIQYFRLSAECEGYWKLFKSIQSSHYFMDCCVRKFFDIPTGSRD